MKKLAERLNFSTQKPQNGEECHAFSVDKISSVAMFDMFCLFCAELSINLDNVESGDFNACVDYFSDYYSNKKLEISRESIDSVTCYFWADEE